MTENHISSAQQNLIRSLVAALEQPAVPVTVFETHISWVLVAGQFAYKFKKAAHFDFLDFSTLAARHFYCQEELRLNRRLAPDIYLDVVRITGSTVDPMIGGAGAAIEYAVKMRAFSQQALWSERIDHGMLCAADIDGLARTLAEFHLGAVVAAQQSPWSSPEALQQIADENLAAIAGLVMHVEESRSVDGLRTWQLEQQAKLDSLFGQRKADGFVRECHGDLHSANILTIDGQVTVFDCIEFNESLRWIDVMNDLAFIYMDLRCHGLAALAARLLNGYLEITGDYAGADVLQYYQTQRALVRCKVALLRARQAAADKPAAAASGMQAAAYLAFARQSIRSRAAAIIIMHGYSGSGKSVISRTLVELIGAVQIRSDVERKRMAGIGMTSAISAPVGVGLYSAAASEATYARLRMMASQLAESGMPVVVDATFLKMERRSIFEKLASDLGVPFFIIDIHASEATLRNRLVARAHGENDPSDAGLETLTHQLAHHDPLTDDERQHALTIDSEAGLDPEVIRKAVGPVMKALHR